MTIGAVDERLASAGITNNTRIEQGYLPLAETMGLYASNGDNASLSKSLSSQRGAVTVADDSAYIYNLKEYETTNKSPSVERDSYFLISYGSEGAFVDAAFGYNNLTGGFNSVDTYIDPFNSELLQMLDKIPELKNPKLSVEEKLAHLYNYIINNFSTNFCCRRLRCLRDYFCYYFRRCLLF